jgi:hypothetical protein
MAVACADWRSAPRTTTVAPPPPPVATVVKREPVPIPLARDECFTTDTTETAAMKCAEGAASRIDDTLQILLSSGRVLRRVDRPQEDENYLRYRYAGRIGGSSGFPAFHLLDGRAYEAMWVEMINTLTGDSLDVMARPVISPDGARFIVHWMGTLETCEHESILQVWRITADKPVREIDVKPFRCGTGEAWSPSAVEWRSRDSISFLRVAVPRDSVRRAVHDLDTTRSLLVHRTEGWAIEPKPE